MAARSKKSIPSPLASTGTTTINREVLGDEYVTDLRDLGQRMRTYTKMRRGDGAINTSLLAIEKPILGGTWDVPGDDPVAQACRDELFNTDRGPHHDPPLIEIALSHLLGMFQYGFAAAEPFWDVLDDGRVHCTNLTLIRQESVRTFKLDSRGFLESLVQYTSALDMGWREITVPVAQLMLAVHAREGADYSGVAIIRSSYRAWISRDLIQKCRLMYHDRFGSGTPTAIYPDGATDDIKSDIDDALENWRAGAKTFIAVPFGTVLEVKGGEGAGYDPTSELAAYAGEIAKNTLSQLMELGTSGNTGNRALGNSLGAVLKQALQGYAEYLAAIIRRQLLTPFVKWNFGDSAEVPQIRCRVTLSGISELFDAVMIAVDAGMKLEPEDIAALRDELELPEIPLEELKARIEARGAAAPDPNAPPQPGQRPPLKLVKSGDKQLSERSFSSTQFNLSDKAAAAIKAMAAEIPDADLAEGGRESNPHITVKYGLHTDDPNDIRGILADEYPPIRATLGKTSFFSTADADVVVVLVDSYELTWLNEKISTALPHTDTHAEYIPHITVAYVKPGSGGKYVNDNSVAGRTLEFKSLVFSSKDGRETVLPIGKKFTLSETGAPLAPDYLGRLRPAKVVALEDRIVKPKLLADALDREAVRATADVHDVLKEIDTALVDQVKQLAEKGGQALALHVSDITVPGRLTSKLRRAIAGAASRANTIGSTSVRNELERQGLDVSAAQSRRMSLSDRFISLFQFGDPDLYGGLAAFLKALVEMATQREVSMREQGAQASALAALGDAATETELDFAAIARRVQSELEDRSVAAVESRVTQVLNVSFGQGRVETGQLFGADIESMIRSEVLDGNTCDWCREHDGDEYAYPDASAPDLPDANCDGTYLCRGIWIYALAKRAA